MILILATLTYFYPNSRRGSGSRSSVRPSTASWREESSTRSKVVSETTTTEGEPSWRTRGSSRKLPASDSLPGLLLSNSLVTCCNRQFLTESNIFAESFSLKYAGSLAQLPVRVPCKEIPKNVGYQLRSRDRVSLRDELLLLHWIKRNNYSESVDPKGKMLHKVRVSLVIFAQI